MTEQPPSAQAAQPKRKPMGKARVKPRHLSAMTWQRIIEEFRVRLSSEDVAEHLSLPARTVSDVIDADRMGLKPHCGRPEPYLLRKSA